MGRQYRHHSSAVEAHLFAPSGPENGRAPNGKRTCEFLMKKSLKRPEKRAMLVFQYLLGTDIEFEHQKEIFTLCSLELISAA